MKHDIAITYHDKLNFVIDVDGAEYTIDQIPLHFKADAREILTKVLYELENCKDAIGVQPYTKDERKRLQHHRISRPSNFEGPMPSDPHHITHLKGTEVMPNYFLKKLLFDTKTTYVRSDENGNRTFKLSVVLTQNGHQYLNVLDKLDSLI